MSPEVLIYLQKIRTFFEKNESEYEKHIGNKDKEKYFKDLTEFSVENFEKNGNPELTIEQFELLRNPDFNKSYDIKTLNKNIVHVEGFNFYSLN